MVTDDKGVTLEEGQQVTLQDGAVGVIRSIHEGGATVWLDPEKQDDGEVRTIGENECRVVDSEA